MSKFEMEFELTGLKVRVKGERGDIPLITQNIGKQVADLLKPAANIVDEQKPQLQLSIQNAVDMPAGPTTSTRRKRTAARSNGSAPAPVQQADVLIDVTSLGTPQQTWTSAEKAIWLLHATAQSGGPTEMTSAEIVRVFNARYRAAKTIRSPNVNRDLTRQKTGADALVDRNDKNGAWFLTEAGKKHASALITKAREHAIPTAS